MSKVKLSESTLFDEIYLLKGTTLRFIGYSVVAIVLGFVTHFPVKSILINNIEKGLATLPCRLEYQSIDLGFFPPAVMLKAAKIPAGCLGDNGQVKLSQFKVNLGLPSLYPFGLKLHTLITSDKSILHIYPLLTFGGIVIKIEDSVIDHQLINALSTKIKMRGKFKPEILMTLKGNVVDSAEFKIEGQQFQIMGQNIMGFDIPDLNFQKLSTAGTLEGENLNLKKVELGDDNSPVVARIKGLIRINKVNALFSNLDLEAEMKFSDQFLQSFSILNLIWRLDQQTKHDGYYKMRLRGPLTSLQNPEFL